MRKATRKRFRSYFEKAKKKTRQTGAHQQIQKNCAKWENQGRTQSAKFQIKQSFSRPQMAVRKKIKVFLLTPTKKLKLRMACGLEKVFRGLKKEKLFQHRIFPSIERNRSMRVDPCSMKWLLPFFVSSTVVACPFSSSIQTRRRCG